MELICKFRDLVLRSISDEDTEDILKWRNSECVKKYFIDQKVIQKQDHIRWLRQKVDTGSVIQFIILERKDRHAIGTVYLQHLDYQNRKAEYGIFIGEENLIGKGIGTAVAKRVIAYAFQELKLHKLYLRVFSDNIRAITSYEKAGFQKEALLKDDVLVAGRFRNIILMGIVNEEEVNDEDFICDPLL